MKTEKIDPHSSVVSTPKTQHVYHSHILEIVSMRYVNVFGSLLLFLSTGLTPLVTPVHIQPE